ncbi:MAG: hypothetical protein QNJ81_07810 [Acidimicrobiia bacterium]|nr:hypothetical protein [Acidimicrobiia bacterium]
MTVLVSIILALLPLSAPFEEATATATSLDGGLQIDVAVVVEGTPVAVIVRGIAPGDSELPPVALADRGDGRWEGIVQLPVVENILIGFESIPRQGPAIVSELHTLTELGVDSAIFSLDNPDSGFGEDDDSLVTPEGARWGWLGLAAGTAALALIAYWTVGSVRARDDEESEPEELLTTD